MTNHLKEVLAQLVSKASAKSALAMVSSLWVALYPNESLRGLVIATIATLALDTFTGVWASYAEGSKVTSKKFGKVLVKFIVYLTFPATLHYAVRSIGHSELAVWATNLMLVFVVSTELLSIFENLDRGGIMTVPKPIRDLIRGKIAEASEQVKR